MPKHLLFILISSFACFILTVPAFADSYGTAVTLPLSTELGSPGSIVCLNGDSYVLCDTPSTSHIYGVVATDTVVSLEDTSLVPPESQLVLPFGETLVRVSAAAGNITSGDYITTSTIAGVGQRATTSGFIVGTALEDFSAEDSTVGTIMVFVDPKSVYIESRLGIGLLEALRAGSIMPLFMNAASLRFLLAVLVVLVSFIVGTRSFSKTSESGVEALGRNPLAGSAIRSAVVFHFILTFGIIFLGLCVAYLILVL